jgi:hypothetical protein
MAHEKSAGSDSDALPSDYDGTRRFQQPRIEGSMFCSANRNATNKPAAPATNACKSMLPLPGSK